MARAIMRFATWRASIGSDFPGIGGSCGRGGHFHDLHVLVGH
ncbi:hypothetical protein ACIBI3_43855 [Actinomadura luteofluorescens]